MNPTDQIRTYLKDHGPMSHDDLGRALDIYPEQVGMQSENSRWFLVEVGK